MNLIDIKNSIIRFFYPDRCLFCDRTVEPGVICCARCERTLPVCEHVTPTDENAVVIGWQAAAFWYRDGVRHAVRQFKFHGRTDAAEFFAPLMLKAILRTYPDFSVDIVVPVPMGAQRLKERGYNQAQLLSREISRLTALSHAPDLLVRRGNLVQHELSARLRRLEADASFGLAEGSAEAVTGKRVLLVDDICTTGSTLRSCARAILEGGGKEVFCVTIGVTPNR